MYDIAIIGAGPAGATFARLIGTKYKVLLLDKRELLNNGAGSFEKCCGGLIAPDAQRVLGKLGLGIPQNVLVGPQLFTVRTIDMQQNIERYYQRHYININREKFDRWMVSLLPPSVHIVCGALFTKHYFEDGIFKIHFRNNGKEYVERAKYLIGADGAFSILRRQLLPEPFQKTYISIQEWFKVKNQQPYFSAVFDGEISDFYSWTIPKEEYILLGTAVLPEKNTTQKLELLKKRLIKYGFEFQNRKKRHGAFILRPISAKQICLGQGNLALIGEAAGLISPTSAEGFSYAFRSALALAQSIQESPDNLAKQYLKNTKELRMNIVFKNMKAPFMYNAFLRKAAMKSGLLSMDIHA